jgi:hypothetical protein
MIEFLTLDCGIHFESFSFRDLAFQVYEKIRDRHERNISNQVIETWPTPVDLDSRTSRTFFAPAFLLDDHDNLPEDFSFNRMLTTYSALVK